MHGPHQFPQSAEEYKGAFWRRTPGGGWLWLLIIFIVGIFVIWTLIWLWGLVT